MSKKQNSTPDVPKTPAQQNEYYYDNGFLRSQRVYDKAKRGYVDQTFSNPTEQGIMNQSTDYIANLVKNMPDVTDPSQISAYKEAYAAPQRRALEDSYNKASGQANMAGARSGMRNSVGFADYTANQLEKNKAQGLADIASNAELMGYQLPSLMLEPYGNAFNIANAALNGEQSQMMAGLEPSFQGSQSANQFALANYQNQLNNWQAQNQARQKSGGGGFMSRLFGGF